MKVAALPFVVDYGAWNRKQREARYEAAAVRGSGNGEYELRTPPDGKKRKIQATGEAVLIARAAASVAKLIQRHRKAVEAASTEAEGLRSALDALPLGVCLHDRDGAMTFCNRRYREIYRLETEPVSPARRRISDLSPSAPASVASVVALLDGRTIKVDEFPTLDGGWTAFHDELSKRPDEARLAITGISLQALFDLVPDYLWVKDVQSRFVIANSATQGQMGLALPQKLIGKSDLDLHPAESALSFFADEQCILQSGQPMIDKEESLVTPDGEIIWLSTTKAPLRGENGEIVGLFGVSRNITARKKSDQFREGQAQILEMIALSSPLHDVLDALLRLIEAQMDGVYASILLIDEGGRHFRSGASPTLSPDYLAAIDGLEIGPNVGSCGAAVSRREPVVVADITTSPLWVDYRELALSFGLRSCWSTPIVAHQDIVLGTFALYSGSVRQPQAEESRLVDLATRIAGIAIERQQAEDRIRFMATHDPLTGLPDRALLNERVTQAIALAERYHRLAAVAFVDLDHFKAVNDSLGHKAGDELLKTVARRMLASVGSDDTVMRIGGDEFVIVLGGRDDEGDALVKTIESLRAAIAEPVYFEGHALHVTGSAGVAFYPRDAQTADALLANADSAMYHAKELGRNILQFYVPALNSKAQEKFVLHEQLRGALSRREFSLFYQPQIDLKTGAVLAVEALIRWNHPGRGLLTPNFFLPLAEETGLINAIGEWVFQEACRQNKAWQDAGLPLLRMCVNVSARQFGDKRLVGMVAAALAACELEPRFLELELTESLIMRDIPQAIATMNELGALGVQLSIDDFGMGYSSLSALKCFPVARLKIDKSFIRGLPDDDEDAAVTSNVITLARKLNLKVIAEGVENERQSTFLSKHQCDEIQGYHCGHPVPIGEIEAMLANLRNAAEVANA